MNHLKLRLLGLSLPNSDIAPSRNTSKGTENFIGISGKPVTSRQSYHQWALNQKKKPKHFMYIHLEHTIAK